MFIAVCLLLVLPSCKKTTSTTPVISTFDITFNGKTYNLSTDDKPPSLVVATTNSLSTRPGYGVSIGARSSQIQCTFQGTKYDDPNTAVGIYQSGSGNGTILGIITLTDFTDGSKYYTSDFTGNDTTSTITVVLSDEKECKGTFHVILTYNGNYYPADGNFDYKK